MLHGDETASSREDVDVRHATPKGLSQSSSIRSETIIRDRTRLTGWNGWAGWGLGDRWPVERTDRPERPADRNVAGNLFRVTGDRKDLTGSGLQRLLIIIINFGACVYGRHTGSSLQELQERTSRGPRETFQNNEIVKLGSHHFSMQKGGWYLPHLTPARKKKAEKGRKKKKKKGGMQGPGARISSLSCPRLIKMSLKTIIKSAQY